MKDLKTYQFVLKGYSKDLKCASIDFEEIRSDIIEHRVYRESFYTLMLIEKGSATVCVNGVKSTVEPRTLICGLPGEVWEWAEEPDVNGIMVCFEPEFILSLVKDPMMLQKYAVLQTETHNPFVKVSESGFERIRDMMIEMKKEVTPTAKFHDMLRAQLWHLIMLIETEYKNNQPEAVFIPPKNIISNFIDLVGANLYRHHDVAFYADKLCITPNYLNKIVTKGLGMSTLAYIQSRIVAEAKVLLNITSMNVNEIAIALGFETANYFVRFFKKHTGITPGKFKKMAVIP